MKNKERITEALTAIAAGILTDILYNMLAGEYFSGKIINGEIEIHKVSPFLF